MELYAWTRALHDQLELAVGAVGSRVGEVEAVVTALCESNDKHAAAVASLRDGMADLGERVALLVGSTDARLEKLSLSVGELLDRPSGDTSEATDPTQLEEWLEHLIAVVDEHLADTRHQIDQGLHRALHTVDGGPAIVDEGTIEDAARRALLPLAAEIVQVRHKVEALAEAVRQQEASIGNLRSSLDRRTSNVPPT